MGESTSDRQRCSFPGHIVGLVVEKALEPLSTLNPLSNGNDA